MSEENKQTNLPQTNSNSNSSRNILIIVGIVIACLLLCCCVFFACPFLSTIPLSFVSSTIKTVDTNDKETKTSNIGTYYSDVFCKDKNNIDSYNSDTTTRFKSSRKLSEYEKFYKDISSNCSTIKSQDDSWVITSSVKDNGVQTKVSFDTDNVKGYMIDFVKEGNNYKVDRIIETFDY